MKATTILSASALAATASANLQINYYNGNGCSSFEGSVEVTWATSIYGGESNCYNYQFGTSANIASASQNALCNFFFNQGCTGGSFQTRYSNGNSDCLTNISTYKSFACYYT